ncbi:unnamed protein product [Cuscuta epithymum]|uniref:RNase H type-1 domain-containing protein n=1 Tax=Cuscuta epithymum TaxID=186058 RepID=A0AAV0FZH9_9ASTE|nr:unnamed protein product [Cuscuta epithymum]
MEHKYTERDGGAINRLGECHPREAEALATREALSWIKETSWSNIDVESDALQLIKAIQDGQQESAFGVIVEDIKDLSTSISGIEFTYVKRSANRVVQNPAKAWFYVLLP